MHTLDIYVDPSYKDAASLHAAYASHVAKHNLKLLENGAYADSGFDLLVPEATHPEYDPENLEERPFLRVDHRIVAAMRRPAGGGAAGSPPTGFYMYPRSSLGTKKRLRLANSVGIIDAGYRGHLIAAFDVLPAFKDAGDRGSAFDGDTSRAALPGFKDAGDRGSAFDGDTSRAALQYERLVQLCAPDLSPVHVTLHPLGHSIESSGTMRGDGGFGSTGR